LGKQSAKRLRIMTRNCGGVSRLALESTLAVPTFRPPPLFPQTHRNVGIIGERRLVRRRRRSLPRRRRRRRGLSRRLLWLRLLGEEAQNPLFGRRLRLRLGLKLDRGNRREIAEVGAVVVVHGRGASAAVRVLVADAGGD
jgi:hypothetical protein